MDKAALIREVIISLFKVNGLKFGSFKLKSGIISPVYFDLRVIISYPEILKNVAKLVSEELKDLRNDFDVLCGVPYTALPIASIISVEQNIPMVLKRKEQKKYGTGNLIEGVYAPGQTRCLIIEDVITSGSSIVETAQSLRGHGIFVDKAIVILDREQGAQVNLKSNGMTQVKSLISMNTMLSVLLEEGLISADDKANTEKFLQENQLFDQELENALEKRKQYFPCKLQSKLLSIMAKKRSNLCLSVDLDDWRKALEVVESVGPKVCMVKTHIDTLGLKGHRIISEFTEKLQSLARTHDFLIMEDGKYGDIGSTTKKQLTSPPFNVLNWADMVTMHGISGPGILEAFESAAIDRKHEDNNKAVVLIAEMSSEGNLPSKLAGYKEAIEEMAVGKRSIVAGFVTQTRVKSCDWLQFTPGVKLTGGAGGDGLGQQYTSVEEAILDRGADVIIVGRGIVGQEKPGEVAEEYRDRGWKAFVKKSLEQ